MIRFPLPLRISIIMLAFASPFIFPSLVTAVLAAVSALIFPPLAIVLGMIMDLLYEPTAYWPIATSIGLVLCLLAVMVRSFVKTRIM